MNVWKPISAKDEPVTELSHWQILHNAKNGEYYFSGWTGYEGRHSSRIVEFNLAELTGKTRSGRIYKLVPDYRGWNPDTAYVVEAWKRINKADTVIVAPEEVAIP